MKKIEVHAWVHVFENDNDALIPEVWAQESLMILESNMVVANLVHRDFEPEIAQFGDTVHTNRPGTFKSIRKTDSDEVQDQDASATDVEVKLNQWHHVTFIIKDGEETKSFKSLVTYHLEPALTAIAEAIDEVLLCQVYEFMGTSAGKLGTDPTKSTTIALREAMTKNKCPLGGRNVIITPDTEGAILNIDDFTQADKIGDDGTTLREANLGRRMGFNWFTCHNTPNVASGSTTVAGAINNGDGYAADSTSLTVDGFSAAITNGSWCTVAGDMTPQMITATVGGATPTSLTITPGLKSAVVDDAVVTVYSPGAINYASDYASGYEKALTVDGFSVAPKAGQLMTIGSGSTVAKYGIINSVDTNGTATPSTTEILPNRPLDAAAADDAVVGLGPAGGFNFAFHRNALALVSRPLATPAQGTGALSYVANYNGLAVRVTITYDGKAQGHRVTIDLLCGVKTLDANLGAVLYA